MSYSEELSKALSAAGAAEGALVEVSSNGRTHRGVLMPHHEFSSPDAVVLKLGSGYNIGVRMAEGSSIRVESPPPERRPARAEAHRSEGLPRIAIIGTGGTIASYVDYRTGAVHPAMTAEELVSAVPELRGAADLRARALFSVFSENMGVRHWQILAEAVAEELNAGADAAIIPHGTDTMGYTAAALSFMLEGLGKPVVLVGAQRSSDRPSSDAPSNLSAALRLCLEGGRAGVFVVMHDGLSDDSFAAHAGTRVRKMHTSRRDAFRSVNAKPVARIGADGISFSCPGSPAHGGRVSARCAMEERTVLLQYYPGMDPAVFGPVFEGSRGIVIAGSGLGHVGEAMVPLIKKARENGSVVAIASQCLGGSTNLNVYSTGRDMLSAGAIPVGDMLPETAYVKLMWALANSGSAEEAERIMAAPLASESGDRRETDV
ncbi:MAG: Glu-tRNA(Gln) amidotransferase subunit GatD [Candidatus Methanoplasma sp.]|jgi:glutamyl-tRNA(Gln) amidotransferase subunit D|nr:Glu-tRNA(Gln) amidotransferase subunit GatD [Candidatus Methanoplasma sp.]